MLQDDAGWGSADLRVRVEDVHALARLVLAYHPAPRNVLDIAVVLESQGYVDAVAVRLGYSGVFQLAAAIEPLIPCYQVPVPPTPSGPAPASSARRAYWQGLGYSMPWILSVLFLFVFRTALWSAFHMTPSLATVISLAFFVASVPTSVVSQMMARRALFYLLQGNRPLFRWTLRRFLLWGTVGALIWISLIYGFIVSRVFPSDEGRVFIEYALGIFAYQLSLVPFYIVRNIRGLMLATATGLLVTLVASRVIWSIAAVGPLAQVDLERAQLLGLAIGAATGFVALGGILGVQRAARYWERTVVPGPALSHVAQFPRWGIVLGQTVVYGLYGLGYFGLLFTDRLVAGMHLAHTVGAPVYWYPERYETADDVGLGAVLPALGLVFMFMEAFGQTFVQWASKTAITHAQMLRQHFSRQFLRQIVLVTAVDGFMALLINEWVSHPVPHRMTQWLAGLQSGQYHDSLLIALGSYAVLPVGLLAAQYLFFLGQKAAPVWAVWIGLVMDLAISLWASHIHIADAVWGLAIGVGFFVLYTVIAAYRCLGRAEEYFYAAF